MRAVRDPLRRVIGDVDPGQFGDPVRELSLFAECATPSDLRAILRSEVENETTAIAELVADADAFDVIELMRMREFAPVPDPRIVVPDGTALPVEIVAAVMLSRPSRKPDPRPRDETRPHEHITEIHDRAQRLGRLALYRLQFEARMSGHPLARLAAEYQGAVLNIRNLQYDEVRREQDERLFDNQLVAPLMRQFLGYDYPELMKVRSAVTKLAEGRMTQLRDDSGDILMRYRDVHPSKVPREDRERFMELMIPFIFLPGDRAVTRHEDVAAVAGITVETADAVLSSYSQRFDATISAGARVFELLTSTNPYLATPLVSDDDGNYLSTVNDVGLDSLRRVFEKALPPNSLEMRKYDKRNRQIVSERLAIEHLEAILGEPVAHSGFTYYAATTPTGTSELGPQCTNLTEVGKEVEGDGLFLIDDVAIIVEVKAKSIAPQARRGDVKRLQTDLKATLGDGCDQAKRLEQLISSNQGVWLGNRSWLDLSHIREIRCIVAVLDDIGPLGTALDDLKMAGIVSETDPPWVASLHDLATIAQVSDRAGEFLLYLRRRTSSDVTTHYRAVDELDLYMLFLEGGLYVEPDPELVRELNPTAPPAKQRDRRRHAQDAVGTMVTDHCHDLNVWMGRDAIPIGEHHPEKPSFNIEPNLIPLLEEVATRKEPGWLRLTTDLLGLSGDTQRKVLNAIRECARRTRQDGDRHECVLSFAGLWGHPALFLATYPPGTHGTAASHLLRYMSAKRYQLRSDRAYGLLFAQDGQLQRTHYINSPISDDPALDMLVDELRLEPVGEQSRPIPPSARRTTKRLRGKSR